MNLLTGKIVQAICWTLLHSLWQGLLLAIITGVVMVLSKKAGSVLRYRLLSAIFIVFVIITGITFYKQLQLAEPVSVSNIINPVQTPVNALPVTPVQGYATPLADEGHNMQYYIRGFVNYFDEHSSLIVTIWFIIFMAQCVKILSGLVHIQRIRHYKTSPVSVFWAQRIGELASRLNIKKTITLLESAIIKVPAVVGFLKPTILVPLGLLNKLSQEEVESILMHELAHIRRKDYLFNLLQCFIDVMFFFNPAILWISSLIRNERENCCDDIAINETKSKKQFIQALVSFHQYNNAIAPKYAMPFATRKHKLVDRVKRIVNNNNKTLNPGEKIVLVGCLIAFGIAFVTVSNGQTDTTKKKQPQQKSSPASTANKPSAGAAKPKQAQSKPTSVSVDNDVKVNTDVSVENDNNTSITYAQLGYKNLTVDQLIELKDHGVNEDYLKELSDAGYKNISLEKAIELRDHGVDSRFVKEVASMGYKNVSINQLMELKDHGVNIEFLHELAAYGYKNISMDEATNLRDHGVNGEYIKEFNDAGYKGLDLEKLTELRDHGVTIEFINSLRKAGVTNITVDKAIEYKDEGFDVTFLSGVRNAGYADVTVEKAMDLRNHGVSLDYISSIKKYGLSGLTLDKLMELKDHGVSPSFIEKMKAKTGSYFTADEYIRLKDGGFEGK